MVTPNFEAIFSAVRNIQENTVLSKTYVEEMKAKLQKLEKENRELNFEKEAQKLKNQILAAEKEGLEARIKSLDASLKEVNLKLKLKNLQNSSSITDSPVISGSVPAPNIVPN